MLSRAKALVQLNTEIDFNNYNDAQKLKIMDFVNAAIGALLVIMGIVIVFIGNYFSRKIGILHVLIYFMASFVIFGGVVFLFFYDKPALV